MKKIYKKFLILQIIQMLLILPCFALNLDSTVTDKSRQNYSTNQNNTSTVQTKTSVEQTTPVSGSEPSAKPEIKQDLPKVPNLPSKANSSTVSPINTEYSGKVPDSNAFIPCTDIKVKALTIDESVCKSKTASKQSKTKVSKSGTGVKYRTALLPKGTQIRVVNKSKITDFLREGQNIVFVSTQEVSTQYFKIPKGAKYTAKVVSAHRPQMSCNGGLVGLRIVSVQANGYNQQICAGIIKVNTDKVLFSNLKGNHTYFKTVSKKAKWGHKVCAKWIKTSHKLADKGAGVIIAPFPYIGGCLVAGASTISSPVTALLGKGDSLVVPANTVFTIKLYEDAHLRY